MSVGLDISSLLSKLAGGSINYAVVVGTVIAE